ncbi:MAG: SMC-Scp complex subunit ScpB [Patescibacteria group bacterium]
MSSEADKIKLKAKLESLLLAAGKAVAYDRLATILKVTTAEVIEAIDALQKDYAARLAGLRLTISSREVALVTNPDYAPLVIELTQQEEMGELTRPQLEALSVIAYRGPISKVDLEQIRGVNCSLILRNLQIRGLVQEIGTPGDLARYEVTMDFLKHLGLSSCHDLPNYQELSSHEILQQFTSQNNPA